MPQDVNPIIDRLVETFPACFSRSAPKPLKIGLGEELMALAGAHPALADLTRTRIRRALKVYTGAPAYRKALKRGGPRYDLAGQPTGEVTPEQQTFARTLRPPATALEPQAPESPATPAMGYLKMSLKRRIDNKRTGLPGGGADGPPSPGRPQYHPQPTESSNDPVSHRSRDRLPEMPPRRPVPPKRRHWRLPEAGRCTAVTPG